MNHLTPVDALKEAVSIAGGQTALARQLSSTSKGGPISPTSIWNWIKRGRGAPADHCPDIEHATGVKCEALRPETNWGFVRGSRKPKPAASAMESAA